MEETCYRDIGTVPHGGCNAVNRKFPKGPTNEAQANKYIVL